MTRLRVGRRCQQIAERRQGSRVPKDGLELLRSLMEGWEVKIGPFPQPPHPRSPFSLPIPGGCAPCPAAAAPSGSVPNLQAPWQLPSLRRCRRHRRRYRAGWGGGGTARGDSDSNFRRKGRYSASLLSPG